MQKIYPYLTYAGAIPFVICAIALTLDIRQLPWLGSIEKTLIVYALVIANFLAGAHWGQHLHLQGKWSRALPISSNILAIVLWLAFLVLSFKFLIIAFVTAFVILLLIDLKLLQDKLISYQYFQTRSLVTAIVILSLIISGIMS